MEIRIFNEPKKIFHIANGRYRTLVSGNETDGKYAVIEMTVPPGT